MLLFFSAILFLLFLIFINKTIEGLTLSEADSLSEIIFKETKDKSSTILESIKALDIKDDTINEIINDSDYTNDEILENLQDYICDLVKQRNKSSNSKYKSNDSDTNLTCPQFTKILNILGVVDINTPDYNAKMNDIKSLSLEDKAYLDVINNTTLDDRAKYNSTTSDNKTLPNDSITSLTYEILNQTYKN